MKHIFTTLTLLLVHVGSVACAQEAKPDEAAAAEVAAATEEVNEDEAAIRKAIDSYVEAFNKGDAAALAAHWTEQGEFVTPAGETLRGRQQLEENLAAFFKEKENAKIELFDAAIDLLSPSVAVETGLARVVAPEQAPNDTEYRAIHVKTAEGWKIDSIREEELPAAAPTHYEQLKDLGWMVGRWLDAEGGTTVQTNCRWTTNQNYLVRSFKVFVEDRVDFEGTQVIGWDPHKKTIRSWMFDSDGGFAVGRWSGAGNRWTAHSLSVLPDGRRASSTNIYELLDENSVRFKSIGRQVDGELQPNIGPVTVVRAANS